MLGSAINHRTSNNNILLYYFHFELLFVPSYFHRQCIPGAATHHHLCRTNTLHWNLFYNSVANLAKKSQYKSVSNKSNANGSSSLTNVFLRLNIMLIVLLWPPALHHGKQNKKINSYSHLHCFLNFSVLNFLGILFMYGTALQCYLTETKHHL